MAPKDPVLNSQHPLMQLTRVGTRRKQLLAELKLLEPEVDELIGACLLRGVGLRRIARALDTSHANIANWRPRCEQAWLDKVEQQHSQRKKRR